MNRVGGPDWYEQSAHDPGSGPVWLMAEGRLSKIASGLQ